MRHPFSKPLQRLHHSRCHREDVGWSPAGSKNPLTWPLPLEPGLHDWGRLAEQHRVTGSAKDEIDMAPMREHLHHLGGREVTIPSDEDMGVGPVAAQIRQQPDQEHRILPPGGPLARSETRGDQGMGGAFKNEQGQVAIALVVMIVEGQFLLAMRRVFRVIEVEDNGGRGLGVTRNEVVHERPGEAVEVGAGHAVFEPGEGRGTRQVLGGVERDTLEAQLEHWVVPQTIGIIPIRIPRGNLINARREKVTERMVNIGGVALVADRRGQAFRETDLPVNPAE
jgi:hypothetical protein